MLRNIVILHAAALGDFVLSWPMALGLARAYAQHRVIYVTHPSKGRLAESVLGVEWRDESLFTGLFAADATLSDKARTILDQAWAVITFAGEGSLAGQIRAYAPRARVATITHRPPAGFDRHVTSFHLDQLNDAMLRGPADMMIKQERWVAGDARPPSFFAGTETSGGQEVSAMKVVTYRCPKCGYLESYAPAQS